MRENIITQLMEYANSTQSKEVLQARGVQSFEDLSNLFTSIRGKPDLAKNYLTQTDQEGLRYTLDVGRALPENSELQGLHITFQMASYTTEPQMVPNGTKGAEMVINIGVRGRRAKQVEEEGGWFNFLVNHINAFFKRSYYIYNIYPKFIRLKYYGSKSADVSIGPMSLGKGKGDSDKEKEYYNKPSVFRHMMAGVTDKILSRIRYAKDAQEVMQELELNNSLAFIRNTYDLLVPEEFKKNLSNSNRRKLFSDLYDLYLNARDELMNNKKVVKLNAAELSEMIRKEVLAALKESDKGTPEWKTIDKHEKTDKSVQPPKEVDGGSTAPKALKDLMGMGGDEVLVKPEDEIPAADKGDEKTQLEPSAKKPLSESKKIAKEDMKVLQQNSFFMNSSDDDVGFRF
jgi:hypothetical protein